MCMAFTLFRSVAFAVGCVCRVGGAAAILGLCGAVAAAQPAAPFNFDLDRMPLHDALQQYSRLTGRSVIYDSGRMGGLYAAGLRGRFTADEALRRLIAGSGMAVSHETAAAVSLVFEAPGQGARYAVVPSSAPRAQRERYYGRLQAQLRRLLCAEPALEAGAYRMVLRLRIAPRPPAIDVLHVVATGRPELEPRIRAALQGQSLDAPPPGFGQPVTLLLTPEGMRRDGGCAP